MTEFIASNGFYVVNSGGYYGISKDLEQAKRWAYSGGPGSVFLLRGEHQALREFILDPARSDSGTS